MDETNKRINDNASVSSSDEDSGSGRGSCERIIDDGEGDASGSRAKRRIEKQQAKVSTQASHLPLSPPNMP